MRLYFVYLHYQNLSIIFNYNWLQCMKPRTQFINDQGNIIMRSTLKADTTIEDNNNHYEGLRGGKPSSLMSTNSLASATRIINYHMFGSLGAPKYYKGKYLTLIEFNWIDSFLCLNLLRAPKNLSFSLLRLRIIFLIKNKENWNCVFLRSMSLLHIILQALNHRYLHIFDAVCIWSRFPRNR